MPPLAYTTQIAATKTVAEIHALLAEHGAARILVEYDADRQPGAVSFTIRTPQGEQGYRLPADAERARRYLLRARIRPGLQTSEQARRVAWRVIKQWLEAQVALLEIGMIDLEQAMLPYAVMEDGRTVYDIWRAQRALPGAKANRP